MYHIGVLLENRLFGLVLAILAALSPNQLYSATQLTNPSVIGFYSSLILLVFLLISKNTNSSKLWAVWGGLYLV